jgi:hypothetical protein
MAQAAWLLISAHFWRTDQRRIVESFAAPPQAGRCEIP